MDFVINNYLIFIIVGVILLMALIGYIADNTNFEKKPKKAKKDKKKKESKDEKVVEVESTTDTLENVDHVENNEMVESGDAISAELSGDNLMDTFEVPEELSTGVQNEESLEKLSSEEVTPEEVSEFVEPSVIKNETVDETKQSEEKTESDDIWKF